MLLNNFISEVSRLLAGFSGIVSKAFMGFFGSIASFVELYNIYDLIEKKETATQFKTRLSTHTLGFLVNVFYTTAAIAGNIISFLGLGFVGLASDCIALLRASYVLHSTRMKAQELKVELDTLKNNYDRFADNAHEQNELIEAISSQREIIRDTRFKYKADTVYSIISVISSGLFVAGLFFPPLLIASIAIFVVAKAIQAYDTTNNYQFSRFLSNVWDALTGKVTDENHDRDLERKHEDALQQMIQEGASFEPSSTSIMQNALFKNLNLEDAVEISDNASTLTTDSEDSIDYEDVAADIMNDMRDVSLDLDTGSDFDNEDQPLLPSPSSNRM